MKIYCSTVEEARLIGWRTPYIGITGRIYGNHPNAKDPRVFRCYVADFCTTPF